MNRRLAPIAVAALAGLGIVAGSAAPAQANNKAITVYGAGGKVIAKAWYDDLTDNLCVKSWVLSNDAVVRIGPSGGSTFKTLVHNGGSSLAAKCSGNMSIPEDRLFWMTLDFRSVVDRTTFYT